MSSLLILKVIKLICHLPVEQSNNFMLLVGDVLYYLSSLSKKRDFTKLSKLFTENVISL